MGGLTVADGERQAPYGMSPVDKYRLSAAGLADQCARGGRCLRAGGCHELDGPRDVIVDNGDDDVDHQQGLWTQLLRGCVTRQ